MSAGSDAEMVVWVTGVGWLESTDVVLLWANS